MEAKFHGDNINRLGTIADCPDLSGSDCWMRFPKMEYVPDLELIKSFLIRVRHLSTSHFDSDFNISIASVLFWMIYFILKSST